MAILAPRFWYTARGVSSKGDVTDAGYLIRGRPEKPVVVGDVSRFRRVESGFSRSLDVG
jgi:hypothetical protein